VSGALRILAVSDVSPLVIRGGAERMLWEYASRLTARGHRVRIVSRSPDGAAPELAERDGIAIRHFPVESRSTLRFAWDSIQRGRRAAIEEITRFAPDVLHVFQPLAAWGALRSAVAGRVPSLYTFLSPAPLEYASRRGMTLRHRRGVAGCATGRLLGLIEGSCVRRATRLHVLSDFSARQLRELYRVPADRIVKIPGGVDTDRFRPADDRAAARRALGWPDARPLLLTVRNLEARMGLDALLRAVARVRHEAPGVLLHIGGDGSLRAPLEALAASLDLGAHVRFLGFVAERELPLAYQAADLFVLPTRELEGFGLVTLEALACGTPVLGTAVGAIPEVLGGLEPAWVVGADAEALAAGVRDHLERAADPRDAAALRRRCRAYAERFDWRVVVERLERELRDVAARRPMPGASA